MNATGTVHLVGAGPGDPGLITVTGLARVRAAEVLVYDHLVSDRLVGEAPSKAERVYVGKEPGRHALTQDEINELLAARARAGRRVVRLKGGDPYVFGRGGEEAAYLAALGVPFEVVPGVTAATAALADAGIPLTHRGHASLAVLVTGHEDPAKPASAIDWGALAALKGTLVFYMGVRNCGRITAALMAHGRPASTPAALVQSGTCPDQCTVVGTLGDIADRAAEARLRPPGLLVVGDVVTLREALNWFERRPLFGQTVVVTRAQRQAGALVARLAELGAAVIEFPTIRIEPPDDLAPLDAALDRVGGFDWIIFTSVNAVRAVMSRLAARTLDARALAGVSLAVIGAATADELRAHALFADLMPATYTAAGLLEELKAHTTLRGARVLLPRSDIAPPDLQVGLEQEGAAVTAVTAYRTVPAEVDPEVLERLTGESGDSQRACFGFRVPGVGNTESASFSPAPGTRHPTPDPGLSADFPGHTPLWVTFTSGSTVRNFAALVGPDRLRAMSGRVRFASLGPATTAAAEQLGLTVAAEAREQTLDALVAAIVEVAPRKTVSDTLP